MAENKLLFRVVVRAREYDSGYRYQVFTVGSTEPRPSQSDNVTYAHAKMLNAPGRQPQPLCSINPSNEGARGGPRRCARGTLVALARYQQPPLRGMARGWLRDSTVLPSTWSIVMDRNPPCSAAHPQCGKCQKPMRFMTAIPQVTEPGRVMIFQCADCEKLHFKPATWCIDSLERIICAGFTHP